jgi:hypothetical protein
MKETVNFNRFYRAFRMADRLQGWTQDGLFALFEYIEELESDLGEEMELDVIAFDCEFTEWESIEEYNKAYECRYEYAYEVSENCTFIDIDGERFIAGEW